MPPESFEKKSNKGEIMMVDDEQDVVVIMGKILKKKGYEVVTACDRLECIKKVETELPDLILLDNIMPNMDGPAVLSKLKASKKTKDIPVIMVTALAGREYIVGAQKGETIKYIIKPFDYTVLLEKIAQTLKSNHKWKVLICSQAN